MDDNNKTSNNDLQENIHKGDEDIDASETNETDYVGVFMSIGIGLGVSFRKRN